MGTLLLLPAMLLLTLFVCALLVLFIYTLHNNLHADLSGPASLLAYQQFLSDPYYWGLLRNTFELGGVVTLLCLVVGYPTAYAMARLRSRHLVLLAAIALFSPLLVSVVVRAFGWLVLLSDGGLVNYVLLKLHIVRTPVELLYNYVGVTISMVHILLPFMVFPIYSVLRQIDGSLNESARDLGAGPVRTFMKITVPLSIAGILAGAQLVFSLCVSAYVSPTLLGGGRVQVLAPAVYQNTIGIAWAMAGVMSFALLILSLAVLVVLNFAVRHSYQVQQSGRTARPATVSASWILRGWLVVVSVFMLAPIVIVAIDSFSSVQYSVFPPPGLSVRWYANLFTAVDWWPAMRTSLLVALCTAVLSVSLGSLAGYAIARYVTRGQSIIRAIFFAPFITPKIGIGLALFIIVLTVHIYGSLLSLVLAHSIITLPFAVAIMSASFVAASRTVDEAAIDLGASPARTFLQVTLPQVKSGLLAAALFVFITSFDEVETSLFLVREGNTTIPIAMMAYMVQNQDPTMAALSSLLIGFSVLLLILAFTVLRRSEVLRVMARTA